MGRFLLTTLLLTACAKPVTGPVSIRSLDVDELGTPVKIDLSYESKGNRKLDVIVKLVNTGIEETEKVVANVQVKGGFDIDEGSTRWEGFVRPRQPEMHVTHLVVAEGFDEAACEVSVMRSQDSKMLVVEQLSFEIAGDGKVRAAGAD